MISFRYLFLIIFEITIFQYIEAVGNPGCGLPAAIRRWDLMQPGAQGIASANGRIPAAQLSQPVVVVSSL